MPSQSDIDLAVEEARARSRRYLDSDGFHYIIFGVVLLLWGGRAYLEAKFNPLHPSGGISNPLEDTHPFGTRTDWLLSLVTWALLLFISRYKRIVEWVRGHVTYPRTGYVVSPSGARKIEFGHILIVVPVFVFALGMPFSDSEVAHSYGLWIVAASFLVSFAGILRCRRARAAQFLYILFPAAAFVLWWYFVLLKHIMRSQGLTVLLVLQGVSFLAIGLIHLFLYIRHNPRTKSPL
jgi:hypothetical protein